MKYGVFKEKGGRYFVCELCKMNKVQMGIKNKKSALRIAARFEGVDIKTYMKLRNLHYSAELVQQ